MGKWVDFEYAGLAYKEWKPNVIAKMLDWVIALLDWLIDSDIEDYFRRRTFIVASMFLASFLQFGATPSKALIASIAAYWLMVLPLGTRHIERVALVVFGFALAGWMEFDVIKSAQAAYAYFRQIA